MTDKPTTVEILQYFRDELFERYIDALNGDRESIEYLYKIADAMMVSDIKHAEKRSKAGSAKKNDKRHTETIQYGMAVARQHVDKYGQVNWRKISGEVIERMERDNKSPYPSNHTRKILKELRPILEPEKESDDPIIAAFEAFSKDK